MRPCDDRDFRDLLPQLVTFPLSSPSMKIKQNWKNNPYGLCTISVFVCYLEDFLPITKVSMIHQHSRKITFHRLKLVLKGIKIRNHDQV